MEHEEAGPLYPELEVQLTGEDGNAFALIGKVSRLIRYNVGGDEAEDFTKTAFAAASYDELLQTIMAHVYVS